MKLLFTLAIISLCTLARAATPATWQNFTIHTGTGAGLPPNAAGVLTNDGSGTLSWVTITGGGGSFSVTGTPTAGSLIVATGTNATTGAWTNTLPTLNIDTLLVGDITVTNALAVGSLTVGGVPAQFLWTTNSVIPNTISPIDTNATVQIEGVNGGYYWGSANAISNNWSGGTPLVGDVFVAEQIGGGPLSFAVENFNDTTFAHGFGSVTFVASTNNANLVLGVNSPGNSAIHLDTGLGLSTDAQVNYWKFGALKSCSAVTIILTNYLEIVVNGVTNAVPIVKVTP